MLGKNLEKKFDRVDPYSTAPVWAVEEIASKHEDAAFEANSIINDAQEKEKDVG